MNSTRYLTEEPTTLIEAADKRGTLRIGDLPEKCCATCGFLYGLTNAAAKAADRENAIFDPDLMRAKENVLVLFPNIVDLTRDPCDAIHNCLTVIRDNSVYREVLRDKTTFYDYWIESQETR